MGGVVCRTLTEKPSARAIFSVTEGRPAVVRAAGPLVYRKLIAAKTFEALWFSADRLRARATLTTFKTLKTDHGTGLYPAR